LEKKFYELEKPGEWKRDADGIKIGFLILRPRLSNPTKGARI
jgi:hypothetical protein